MLDERDISELVHRYLNEVENALGLVEDGKADAAALMQTQTQALRAFLANTDAATRKAVEMAILQTVVVEGLTDKALSGRLVDEHLERLKRILKTPTLTAADLLRAESKYPTRKQQAAMLGIGERHLRRLRRGLL